jgi:hypothetical protein
VIAADRSYPAVFRGMSEVSPLLTEPAVVLIPEVGLVKNHLRLKGMANPDTPMNEPASGRFQQLSLTERSLAVFPSIAGQTG